MQIVLFTIVAVALYFFADWLLRVIEHRRGAPLPNRNLIFFAILLIATLVSFEIIQRLLEGAALYG